MKKELISLLVNEICKDKTCNKCKYSKIGCYLIDMIELIKKYDIKENDNMKNKNGVDIEITEKEIEEYATCTSCKKPSSYLGKMYWFNGKLYCKDCLIQELLKEKVIYDNWYSNC